ncbi:HAF repeat-containing protein [Amycolatopsis sp. FU40]|uniref:HAF repeat-containing protein n=1 Tax=Amycolatopsis sp. FU40 TaxID=2914159 RepID=UPI001F3F7EF6|nr:HAF repeat-containing protein [Amycolatopsis sp. FU40]UKD57971.1 HAF repeat-containing protein [Amycolatopsis sp. FU40]
MTRNSATGRRRACSLAAALLVFAGATTGTARADPLAPTDLAPLPGDDQSLALAVNEAGTAVGTSSAGRDPRLDHPVRWDTAGRPTALPTPGAAQGQARAINSQGVAAGYVLTPTIAIPARWDAAGQATLMPLPPGYHNAMGEKISDTGVVVGEWQTPDGLQHPFRWDPDGQVTDLGTLPGDTWAVATGISADGTIVSGQDSNPAKAHSVRWVNGGPITDLAPAAWASANNVMNRNGTIAGHLTDVEHGSSAPVTWDRDGVLRHLQWPSANPVWLNQVSPAGYVTGSGYLYPPDRDSVLWDPDGNVYLIDGDVAGVDSNGNAVGASQNRATVWYDNGNTVRFGILPGGSHSKGEWITDSGYVVGSADTAGYKMHAVAWKLG